MEKLPKKELKRRIKEKCRNDYSTKVTYNQIINVLLAFRDVCIESVIEGKSVEIPRFIRIYPSNTSIKILPDGTNNTPRLTIRCNISEVCKLDFKRITLKTDDQYDYIEED